MGNKDRRFRSIERKVGAFTVLAAATLLVVLLFMGVQRDLFTPQDRISFHAESATGLSEGMAVKFRGFRIGKVDTVSLDENGQVEVVLLINKEHMRWVRGGSEALLVQEGVIGETIIEITKGEGAPLEEGAWLTFRRSTGIGDVAQELKGQVEDILAELRKTVHYINDPEGDIKSSLDNLERFTGGLEDTRRKLDGVIQSGDHSIDKTLGNIDSTLADIDGLVAELTEGSAPRLNGALESIKWTASGIGGVVNSVDASLPAVLDDLRQAVRDLRAVAADIANASSGVPPLVQEGGLLVDDGREVMGAVKEIWPVKNHIEEPEQEVLEVDSYE